MIAVAVLDTIDLSSRETSSQRVMDDELDALVKVFSESYGGPVRLHDGTMLFVSTAHVGSRAVVIRPDGVMVEGISITTVFHIRPIVDGPM